MANLTLGRNLVPARYDATLHVRMSKDQKELLTEACRRLVKHRSEFIREAIAEKLEREG